MRTTTRSCRSRGAELARDEGIRDDTSLDRLGTLKALFAADGTVTAGNSSPINDGASAVLLV
uniref:thiolase family protein n=1 Tax=Microbacterium trichothecenolyticum TaxID=69370 RepID=UPI004045B4C3